MPPTNSSAKSRSKPRFAARVLALAGAAVLAATMTADPAPLPALMPLPAHLTRADGRLVVTPTFAAEIPAATSARLQPAVARMLAAWQMRTGIAFSPAGKGKPGPAGPSLVIACAQAVDRPRLGDDERYTLEITPTQATLRAATDVGALRGLATLTQLLVVEGDRGWLPAVKIEDAPRFPWRGLMIDVSRHWEPVGVIERNLDAMALVKLNVLHLHLTDDQGFRIESRTHPELPAQGSDGHFFTQDQMRGIIAYAGARGIRVVPEFDIPGHATSWVVSHPELASAPGPYAIERKWGVFDPVLDPTNEKTYALLADFLGEMAALFPDEFLHIGGDENNGVQWTANAAIQAYIRDHHLKDNAGLHAMFNTRIAAILREHGKRVLGWDEILHPDLPADAVIHSWRGPDGIVAAARLGHAVLLSNGYYIDLNYPAADHYLNDPLPADTPLTPEQQKLVLGGEATMWAEWVTPEFIDTRIWPRTAAIAERLWSPREIRDVPDMYRRLATIDQRLQEAGTKQGDWPVFDLPGLAADSPETRALSSLAALVEPVKRYERGGLQPGENQLSPRNRLADWALPESAPARRFRWAVDNYLFAAGDLDPAKAAALTSLLTGWHDAGELAAKISFGSDAIAQAQTGTAQSLAAIAQAGGDAIAALQRGEPLAADRLASARAALDAAGQHTAAAVEFPFLSSLRLLVEAAAAPAQRGTLPRADWKARLEAAASPAPAAP